MPTDMTIYDNCLKELVRVLSHPVIENILLTLTFIALILTLFETIKLRKEQRITNYLTIIYQEYRDKDGAYKSKTKYPQLLKDIANGEKLDFKKLFSHNHISKE